MASTIIEDLINQCTHTVTTYENGIDESYEEFDKEKFAELIVKECMAFQHEAGVYSRFDMASAIARHFGVE